MKILDNENEDNPNSKILEYCISLKFDLCSKLSLKVFSKLKKSASISQKKENENDILREDVQKLTETNESLKN